MKYCSNCKVLNEEDAKVCKICGRKLDKKTKTNKNDNKHSHSWGSKKRRQTKVKTKIKTKTIVKDKREKGRMNIIQKIGIFILFNLCLILFGTSAYLAYHIYKEENIIVPNVIGFTYEEAEDTLKNVKLNAEKIEKEVEEESQVGIVIDQNKRKKASENTIVKLTVGIKSKKIIVPKLTGLNVEEAIEILNKQSINYKIKYKEYDSENIVISQNKKPNEKIKTDEEITIEVSKKKEIKQITEETKNENEQE